MRPDFEEKLASFVAGCQRIRAEYRAANNYKAKDEARWNVTRLKRYARIENPSVYCYVDLESGEVFKPAGWKGPAKTKTRRGNIFDEFNGLKHMGPHGVALADEINQTGAGAMR